MTHYKLTYFDLRGRAEPIRMLFAIAGVPYEDVRLSKEEWEKLKKDTPFEALPMLEVDGVKIAQSLAILRYVARETGFAGPDNLASALADSLCDQYQDFIVSMYPWLIISAGHGPGDEEELYTSNYMPARAKHFSFFEAALKKSSTGWYASTPDITHADVFIAASLEWLKMLDKNHDKLFEGFSLMEAHYEKFLALPELQNHLAARPETHH